MTITNFKISHSSSIEYVNELGLKRWSKNGCEFDIDNHDDKDEAFEFAKKAVNDAHQKNIPKQSLDNAINTEVEQVIQVQRTPQEQAIQEMIKDIDKCSTIKGIGGLNSYKLLADQNINVKEAYDKRFKELSK